MTGGGNDVTVNNKGGAPCNNGKTITSSFFTCHEVDCNFASGTIDPVLLENLLVWG